MLDALQPVGLPKLPVAEWMVPEVVVVEDDVLQVPFGLFGQGAGKADGGGQFKPGHQSLIDEQFRLLRQFLIGAHQKRFVPEVELVQDVLVVGVLLLGVAFKRGYVHRELGCGVLLVFPFAGGHGQLIGYILCQSVLPVEDNPACGCQFLYELLGGDGSSSQLVEQDLATRVDGLSGRFIQQLPELPGTGVAGSCDSGGVLAVVGIQSLTCQGDGRAGVQVVLQ